MSSNGGELAFNERAVPGLALGVPIRSAGGERLLPASVSEGAASVQVGGEGLQLGLGVLVSLLKRVEVDPLGRGAQLEAAKLIENEAPNVVLDRARGDDRGLRAPAVASAAAS